MITVKKKKKREPVTGFILLVVFLLFTVLVKTVDVKAVGPEGSSVGFAELNSFFHELTGYNETWYRITEVMGYISLACAGGIALFGLWQLVSRKSLKKVDADILVTGVFFAVVLFIYVLFDKVVINYRPVLEDGKLEASYPSSHTVLALCVMAALVLLAGDYLSYRAAGIVRMFCCVFMILMAVGRLLSGVHWLTDILGAILISASLISLYTRAMRIFGGRYKEEEN